jgi:hypothetical protein
MENVGQPDENEPLSRCPGKCGIGKAAKAHPNMVRDLDLAIVDAVPLTTVAETFGSKLNRCCDLHPTGFGVNYNIVYRHRQHIIAPIKPPAPKEERFAKNDQSQKTLTNPEFVTVTRTIRRRDIDRFRKIDVRGNLNERLQSLERELKAIDDKLDSIPPEKLDEYPALHSLKLKYTAEYRLLNKDIADIREKVDDGQQMDPKTLKDFLENQKKKDDTGPPPGTSKE